MPPAASGDLPPVRLGYARTPLRRKLVDSVLRGDKTATAGLRADHEPHSDEPLPRIGDRSVLLGFDDEPVAVVETTEVRVDPAAWNVKFKPDLAAAVDEIRQRGLTDIRIDGAFRLSTGFAAGAAAPRAAGLTVAFRDWSSKGESTEFPVAVTVHHVGKGGELAVALCVTGHIERDVLEYIQANSLPVAKLIEIAPGSGVGQTSIPGEAEALGFVFAAFDEIRRSARSAAKLHLFQSAPNGIGILLGHLWNRVPVTQLYDDANSPEGYFPTFLLAS